MNEDDESLDIFFPNKNTREYELVHVGFFCCYFKSWTELSFMCCFIIAHTMDMHVSFALHKCVVFYVKDGMLIANWACMCWRWRVHRSTSIKAVILIWDDSAKEPSHPPTHWLIVIGRAAKSFPLWCNVYIIQVKGVNQCSSTEKWCGGILTVCFTFFT